MFVYYEIKSLLINLSLINELIPHRTNVWRTRADALFDHSQVDRLKTSFFTESNVYLQSKVLLQRVLLKPEAVFYNYEKTIPVPSLKEIIYNIIL